MSKIITTMFLTLMLNAMFSEGFLVVRHESNFVGINNNNGNKNLNNDNYHDVKGYTIRSRFIESAMYSEKTRFSSSSQPPSSSNHEILFQKVLRSSSSLRRSTKMDANVINCQFLPNLIDFIQTQFTIPTNLPMVYEVEAKYGNDSNKGESRSIAFIDSPLSSDPSTTRMEVEVVGIYPESEDITATSGDSGTSAFPSMVMVVVRKQKSLGSSSNDAMIMTRSLFETSEKKILNKLDRDLDDLAEGRDSFTSNKKFNPSSSSNMQDATDDGWIVENLEAIDAEHDLWGAQSSTDDQFQSNQKDELPLFVERDGMGDVVIDASYTSSDVKDDQTISTNSNEHVNRQIKESAVHDDDKGGGEDYAVQMAAKIAQQAKLNKHKTKVQRDHQSNSQNHDFVGSVNEESKLDTIAEGGDYAVNAAKAAAAIAARKTPSANFNDTKTTLNKKVNKKKKHAQKKIDSNPNRSGHVNFEMKPEPVIINQNSGRKIDRKPNCSKFRYTISTPKAFSKHGPSATKILSNTETNDSSINSLANSHKIVQKEEKNEIVKDVRISNETTMNRDLNIVKDISFNTNESSEEQRLQSFDNLHIKGKQNSISRDKQYSSKDLKDKSINPKISKSDEEIENDIIKSALDLMPTLKSDDGEENGLTPEELLADVLKFGEEYEKKEQVGNGFVSGAFEKAKTLIESEQKSRQRNQDQIKFSETIKLDIDIKDEESSSDEPLSAEEELRRIFAAGENIAEGKIKEVLSDSKDNTVSLNKKNDDRITDEYVNNLIQKDKTVSQNIRSLDDELVELELRVGKSVEMSPDGPHGTFDVFSGPELYNPNVDPESAVNWPGAEVGTRTDVKLPPELSIAVENSKFATGMLSRLEERQDENGENVKYFVGEKELSAKQVNTLKQCVEDGVSIGLIQDPVIFLEERARLSMVLNELTSQPEDRFEEITMNFKDLLLSDNIVNLIKDRIRSMEIEYLNAMRTEDDVIVQKVKSEQETEKKIISKLTTYIQIVLKEVRALGAELEANQLEVVRSICMVAMNPDHKTEEDTAIALTDAVRDMRPLLDENFVAYLKYAIAEEEGRLARAGVLDDPEHNRWLFILKIVQEGVYTELAVSVSRYIDHIWYILRMETKEERRLLLKKLIDAMPTMDIRPFLKVVDNIVASLGMGVKGEFDVDILGGMTNKLLQLNRDVKEFLPPETVDILSKDADEWADRQRKRLAEARNMTNQRIKAGKATEQYDSDLPGRGEVERMT